VNVSPLFLYYTTVFTDVKLRFLPLLFGVDGPALVEEFRPIIAAALVAEEHPEGLDPPVLGGALGGREAVVRALPVIRVLVSLRERVELDQLLRFILLDQHLNARAAEADFLGVLVFAVVADRERLLGVGVD